MFLEGEFLKVRRPVIVSLILLVFMIGWIPFPSENCQLDWAPMINGHDKPRSVIVKSNLLEPIEIVSDDDFETTVWTGSGSISNPYVLANKIIEGEFGISIERVSSCFRIENCTITSEYAGIFLRDTSNSVIINNTIKSGSVSISIVEATNCTIANNSISQFSRYWAPCIALYESRNVTVHDNVIKGGPISIYVEHSTSHCTIINNTMACNDLAIFLDSSTSNNSIIGNKLGCLLDEMAIDDGTNNTWDDGVSLGNAWIDYEEIGEYLIPGSANSVDHFPTVFNPSFPMDFDGPYIRSHAGGAIIDYCNELPEFFSFIATVNDSSGVDTVIITINHVSYYMEPSDLYPDIYVYDHPIESTMIYSIWANDTVGLESESDVYMLDVGVMWCPPSIDTTNTNDYFMQISLALAGGILLVVVVSVIFMRKRESVLK